jgi:hypothetical protein
MKGISELLGYAIAIGMVATAVICITSGAAGRFLLGESAIGSDGIVKSLAAITMDIARTNNTCYMATNSDACKLGLP